MGLNVYCRVSNLLDRRNVLNVYSATGSATDDGYIASEIGSRQLENIEGSQRQVARLSGLLPVAVAESGFLYTATPYISGCYF